MPDKPRTKSLQTESFEIPGSQGLDAVTVFFQDFSLGKGRVVLECYGSIWCSYFGAMGGNTIREFFVKADADYMVNKLGNSPILKMRKRDDAYLRKIIVVAQEAMSPARKTDARLEEVGDAKP